MHSWHVLGAGAMGRLIASYFVEHGCQCTLIRRNKKQFSHTTSVTIRRLYPEGSYRNFKVKLAQPSTLTANSIKNLLITTKAFDVVNALQSISHALDKQTRVILAQNGLGSQQEVCNLLRENSIWAASITHGAWKKNDNTFNVYYAGKGQIYLGPIQENKTNHVPFDADALPFESIDIQECENITEHLWTKLAINSVINPLTVLHNCHNGHLLKARFQSSISALTFEASKVLKANGFDTKHLQIKIEEVIKKTANNISSTLQDYRNKKPTELSFINGYLLRQANKHNLSLPKNVQLQKQLALLDVIF